MGVGRSKATGEDTSRKRRCDSFTQCDTEEVEEADTEIPSAKRYRRRGIVSTPMVRQGCGPALRVSERPHSDRTSCGAMFDCHTVQVSSVTKANCRVCVHHSLHACRKHLAVHVRGFASCGQSPPFHLSLPPVVVDVGGTCTAQLSTFTAHSLRKESIQMSLLSL